MAFTAFAGASSHNSRAEALTVMDVNARIRNAALVPMPKTMQLNTVPFPADVYAAPWEAIACVP
eukprot:CAMPEP_0197458230 /NCGR_PEP_ID=MMETSP1175-20131217/48100_1 /TAXON_ID=1003142 /ORGANISM="Triceratium dubium, Strain CCMP147" /LENGTH=63 /DNA_ID=CAMNT_0042992809 /DNA_START=41 /DNA_END=232 /DNA_ORIENTATION=+